MVEIWFSILTKQQIRRGVYDTSDALH